MISSPNFSGFRCYFANGFILDNTRKKYLEYFKSYVQPFETIIDYINSTIIDANLPGLTDDTSNTQVGTFSGDMKNDSGRTRSFRTGLHPKEGLDKKISIEFELKNAFLNWIIMYSNMVEYLNTGSITHMPNIILQVVDDEDNIIYELIYKYITIRQISDIKFSKQDAGIGNKTFTMEFGFDDFEFVINLDKTQSTRYEELHTY